MGRWRDYRIGDYRLGQLKGEAVAVWWDGDKRARWRLGVNSESEGRAALDRFARHRAFATLSASPTCGEIMALYIADRALDGKQVDVMRHNWKALAPTFEAMLPAQVTSEMCRDYAKERFAAGRAKSTVLTELLRLRTALNWAVKRKMLTAAPYIWTPSPSPARDRVLTEPELIRLLDGCREAHVKLFVILALTTGGRKQAILDLTWDRVDFAAGSIDLRKPRAADPMSKAASKGRAIVAMNNLARAALSDARPAALSDTVIEWRGAAVASVKTGFSAAVKRAGLKGVSPHALRHTAATMAWNAGVDPHKVQRFLGHRHLQTTTGTYAHPQAEYVRDAADVVDIKATRAVRK